MLRKGKNDGCGSTVHPGDVPLEKRATIPRAEHEKTAYGVYVDPFQNALMYYAEHRPARQYGEPLIVHEGVLAEAIRRWPAAEARLTDWVTKNVEKWNREHEKELEKERERLVREAEQDEAKRSQDIDNGLQHAARQSDLFRPGIVKGGR